MTNTETTFKTVDEKSPLEQRRVFNDDGQVRPEIIAMYDSLGLWHDGHKMRWFISKKLFIKSLKILKQSYDFRDIVVSGPYDKSKLYVQVKSHFTDRRTSIKFDNPKDISLLSFFIMEDEPAQMSIYERIDRNLNIANNSTHVGYKPSEWFYNYVRTITLLKIRKRRLVRTANSFFTIKPTKKQIKRFNALSDTLQQYVLTTLRNSPKTSWLCGDDAFYSFSNHIAKGIEADLSDDLIIYASIYGWSIDELSKMNANELPLEWLVELHGQEFQTPNPQAPCYECQKQGY